MNNNVIEDAFIAKMGEAGHDSEFIRGFLHKSAEMVDGWEQVLKEAMVEDPEVHTKIAEEIISNSPMYKKGGMEEIQKILQGLGGAFGADQKTDPSGAGMRGGMIGGGGMGSMIGMVLAKILGIHPALGMLLGTALGLGAGGMIGGGSNVSGQNNFTNSIKDMLGAGRSNDIERGPGDIASKAGLHPTGANAQDLAEVAKADYNSKLDNTIGTNLPQVQGLPMTPKDLSVEKPGILDKTIGRADGSLPTDISMDLTDNPSAGMTKQLPGEQPSEMPPLPPGFQASIPLSAQLAATNKPAVNVGSNPPNYPESPRNPANYPNTPYVNPFIQKKDMKNTVDLPTMLNKYNNPTTSQQPVDPTKVQNPTLRNSPKKWPKYVV